MIMKYATPAIAIRRAVGAVIAAAALSTVFAGAAGATIDGPRPGPSGPCSTIGSCMPPKGPEAPAPPSPGPDTVLPPPDQGGCKGMICFP